MKRARSLAVPSMRPRGKKRRLPYGMSQRVNSLDHHHRSFISSSKRRKKKRRHPMLDVRELGVGAPLLDVSAWPIRLVRALTFLAEEDSFGPATHGRNMCLSRLRLSRGTSYAHRIDEKSGRQPRVAHAFMHWITMPRPASRRGDCHKVAAAILGNIHAALPVLIRDPSGAGKQGASLRQWVPIWKPRCIVVRLVGTNHHGCASQPIGVHRA